jgi:hypothetical protein
MEKLTYGAKEAVRLIGSVGEFALGTTLILTGVVAAGATKLVMNSFSGALINTELVNKVLPAFVATVGARFATTDEIGPKPVGPSAPTASPAFASANGVR